MRVADDPHPHGPAAPSPEGGDADPDDDALRSSTYHLDLPSPDPTSSPPTRPKGKGGGVSDRVKALEDSLRASSYWVASPGSGLCLLQVSQQSR